MYFDFLARILGEQSESEVYRFRSFLFGWTVYDYEEAARIRDSMKLFEEEEPVLRLRRLIKEAVGEEKFEVNHHL